VFRHCIYQAGILQLPLPPRCQTLDFLLVVSHQVGRRTTWIRTGPPQVGVLWINANDHPPHAFFPQTTPAAHTTLHTVRLFSMFHAPKDRCYTEPGRGCLSSWS